jgi:hypothetical protein
VTDNTGTGCGISVEYRLEYDMSSCSVDYSQMTDNLISLNSATSTSITFLNSVNPADAGTYEMYIWVNDMSDANNPYEYNEYYALYTYVVDPQNLCSTAIVYVSALPFINDISQGDYLYSGYGNYVKYYDSVSGR